MGWFTNGWFTNGWFRDVLPEIIIATPAKMNVDWAVPEAQVKLGQKILPTSHSVTIFIPTIKNRTGVRVAAEVYSLNNHLASETMVKTGSRNQANLLNAVLASKPNALKTGFKYISMSCSIDNKMGNSPLLRTGTKQNIIAFNI